jgi:Arc/MetJ-type ribon-helix-helix transcriptional regulator
MRNITINIPKAFDFCIQVLVALGFYPSRSEALRVASRRYLKRELEKNLDIFHYPELKGMEIITINMEENVIDALEQIGTTDSENETLYPSRSETIRVATREFILEELPIVYKMKEQFIDDLDKKIEDIKENYLTGNRFYLRRQPKKREPLGRATEIDNPPTDEKIEENDSGIDKNSDELLKSEPEVPNEDIDLIELEDDDLIKVEDGNKVYKYEKLTEVIEEITITETNEDGEKSDKVIKVLKKLS